MTGQTVESTFLGEASEHLLQINGAQLKVICAPPVFDPPAQMTVEFGPDDVVVLRS